MIIFGGCGGCGGGGAGADGLHDLGHLVGYEFALLDELGVGVAGLGPVCVCVRELSLVRLYGDRARPEQDSGV
jgi:hypothetical protein